MSALDVIQYGQGCQSIPGPPASPVARYGQDEHNPSSGQPEETQNDSAQPSPRRLETSLSAEFLHFPELEGDSGEEGCCELLTTLQTVLERACCQREPARGDELPQQASCSGRPSPFHGSRVPAISLGAYIQRISRFSKCSNICFVMAYSYMQRLAQADEVLRPCAQNAHRLLITAVLLSAKLMDDNIYNNSYWAKIGGVPTAELSALELAMLQRLDYRLLVQEEEVAHRLRELKVLAHSSCDAGAVQRRPKAPSN